MTLDPIAARARELAHFIISRTCDESSNWSALEDAVTEKITTALQAERERAIEECAEYADMLASQYEAEDKQACTLNIRASDAFPPGYKAKHWRILEQAIRALAAKKVG